MGIIQILEATRRSLGRRTLGGVAAEFGDDEWNLIREFAARGVSEFCALSREQRRRWGAAFLLVGARCFRELDEPPYRYSVIEDEVHATVDFDPAMYDALEEGAVDLWGIDVLRASDGRRMFIGTMVGQSGAGWTLLLALSEIIARKGLWDEIADWTVADLAQYLQQSRGHYLLDSRGRRVLATDDGALGVARRLLDFATLRRMATARGAEDVDSVWDRLRGEGDVVELLDAPSARDARLLLERWVTSQRQVRDTAEPPRYRCLTRLSGSALVIALPGELLAGEVAIDVDRARLRLDGSNEMIVYRRSGSRFVSTADTRHVSATSPATVIRETRRGGEVQSEIFAEMALPEPVALFDAATGELTSAPRPGSRVIAVGSVSLSVEGGTSVDIPDWHAVEFEMPESPIVVAIGSQEVTVTPSTTALGVSITGTRIAGLRFGRAPAYAGTPVVEIDNEGEFYDWTLSGPVGEETGCTAAGFLRFDTDDVGSYRLDARIGLRQGAAEWFALPSAATFENRCDQTGCHISVRGIGARLALPGLNETPSESLFVPASKSRSTLREVRVQLNDGEVGVWRVRLTPRRIDFRKGPGGDLIEEPSYEDLRGGGGLQVSGPPGEKVSIRVGERVWSYELPSHGSWFFAFSAIPGAVLRNGRVRLEAAWSGEAFETIRLLIDPLRERPKVVLGAQVRVCAPHPLNDPRLGVVKAWAPWERPAYIDARQMGRDGDGVWYTADLSALDGPRQCALFDGSRRATGCFLFDRPGEPPDTEICRVLWRKPRPNDPLRSSLEKFLEERPDADEIGVSLLEMLDRFGAGFFRVAEAACDILTHLRLRRWLEGDRQRWFRVFDDVHRGMLATTHRALDRLGDEPAEKLAKWFAVLDEAQLGLAVHATQSWASAFGQIAPLAARWQRAVSPGARPLTHAEVDAVRTPDAVENVGALDLSERPRLLGVLQARRFVVANREDQDLQRMAAGPPSPRLPTDAAPLPPAVTNLERAVIALSESIHDWRRDVTSDVDWQQVDILYEGVPGLFDYWLNLIASDRTREETE